MFATDRGGVDTTRVHSIRLLTPMETATVDNASADAFAVSFIRAYRRPIWYAINLEHVPFDERSDVYQEVCSRILDLSRRGTLRDGEPSTATFVIIMVRNLCRSYFSKVKRHRGGINLDDVTLISDTQDPAQLTIRSDAHARLHTCIELLPPTQRLIMRAVITGTELKEIAKTQDMHVAHVKTLAHRARIRLRQLLTNPNLN